MCSDQYRWIVEFVTPPQGGRRRHRRKVSQWWNLITLFDVLSQLEIEAIHFPPPQRSSRHAMDKVLGWRWGWRVSERLNWIPNYDYKRICGAHYTLYYITAFPLKPVPDDMRFWWMDSHRVTFCVPPPLHLPRSLRLISWFDHHFISHSFHPFHSTPFIATVLLIRLNYTGKFTYI